MEESLLLFDLTDPRHSVGAPSPAARWTRATTSTKTPPQGSHGPPFASVGQSGAPTHAGINVWQLNGEAAGQEVVRCPRASRPTRQPGSEV